MEQLSKKTQAYKTSYLHHSTMLDLGNLVRCAMQAQISPDTIVEKKINTSRCLSSVLEMGAYAL